MGEGSQFRHMMERWTSTHAGSYSGWPSKGPSMAAKQSIPTPSSDPKESSAGDEDDSSRALALLIGGIFVVWILTKK